MLGLPQCEPLDALNVAVSVARVRKTRVVRGAFQAQWFAKWLH